MRYRHYPQDPIELEITRKIVGEFPGTPIIPEKPKLFKLNDINFFYQISNEKYFIIILIGFYIWMYIENDYFLLNFLNLISVIYLIRCFSSIINVIKELKSYNHKLEKQYKLNIERYENAKIKFNDYHKRRDLNSELIKQKVEERIKSIEIAKDDLKIRLEKLRKERQKRNENLIFEKISTPKLNINSNSESKVIDIIRLYSGICAGIAIQPIPFADIFLLTPTQIIMGNKIANIRGYDISKNSINEILKEISSIIGMGLIAQQLVIGSYKTFLPFMGGLTTIPVVYGLTFGIGKVMDYYILAKMNGENIDENKVKELFKHSQKTGITEGKLKENKIILESKNKGLI